MSYEQSFQFGSLHCTVVSSTLIPWRSERQCVLKLTKPRYQQGSIQKVPRAQGWVWKVRFSNWTNEKRHQKCFIFSGSDFPAKSRTSGSFGSSVAGLVPGAVRTRDGGELRF